MSKKRRAQETLQRNKDKKFVKRILKPDGRKVDYGNGSYATHQMSAEIKGRPKFPMVDAYAFPTVVQRSPGLQVYDDPQKAMRDNVREGNAIRFNTIQEAVDFTRNYKTKEFTDSFKTREDTNKRLTKEMKRGKSSK